MGLHQRRWRQRAHHLVAILALLALALAGEAAAGSPPTMVVFGDSYSVVKRTGAHGWPTQLDAKRTVDVVANMARSGATAGGTRGLKSFKGQVDAWLRQHGNRPAPDLTAVLFGYNDVPDSPTLTAAKTQYRRQIDRLIKAGVTSGSRRLVLIQLHDITHNPATNRDHRARVLQWNRFVRSVARSRPNTILVDLLPVFDRVVAQPRRFGFKNVTTADRARSHTTALFIDGGHFGERGQAIIADTVRSAIARGKRSYELAASR